MRQGSGTAVREGGTVVKVKSLRPRPGIAGQSAVNATVLYEFTDGSTEEVQAQFVGSMYGTPGPVVVMLESGAQFFVDDPARFGGSFGVNWVIEFYLREA